MASTTAKEPPSKRSKPTKPNPTTFVTWNCNGFTSRCLWDADQMKRLLEETSYPDMIFLQEARLKASSPTCRDRPFLSTTSKGGTAVPEILATVFQDYRPFWSLADTMYAGTLTLVHKRLGPINPKNVAFSTDWATDVLLERFHLTRKGVVGLSSPSPPSSFTTTTTSTSSSTASTNTTSAPKQTSLLNFFGKKTPAASTTTTDASSTSSLSPRIHDPEGRFQFFSFETMDILQTYVPNNGNRPERHAKRNEWDERLLRFLQDRQTILKAAAGAGGAGGKSEDTGTGTSAQILKRPLLWCGDMNVARTYLDGTHWSKVKNSNSEREGDDDDDSNNFYEWWTDERKCFVGGERPDASKNPDDRGMPSFTPAERRRFDNILQQADLVDLWRERHPQGVTDFDHLDPWERPNYTWRGHVAKPGSQYAAKYEGKGQRLDYFLLSPSSLLVTKDIVEDCRILGYGTKKEGLYCGSDHCASILKIRPLDDTM